MARQQLTNRAFLCDSNVWVALVVGSHVHHPIAEAWWDSLDEDARILFCRATQLSFLRLITTASLMAGYGLRPFTNETAWRAYEGALADDRVVFQTNEPDGLEASWNRYALRGTASPKLWMDAYLAAFALAGDYRLVTTDKDYRQFNGLDLLLLGGDSVQS